MLLDKKQYIQTTQNYFKQIVEKINDQFNLDIKISYNINAKIKEELLIYYGLILNELVTNSFKHAFLEKGEINIELYEKEGNLYFIVEDDGVGLKDNSKKT